MKYEVLFDLNMALYFFLESLLLFRMFQEKLNDKREFTQVYSNNEKYPHHEEYKHNFLKSYLMVMF